MKNILFTLFFLSIVSCIGQKKSEKKHSENISIKPTVQQIDTIIDNKSKSTDYHYRLIYNESLKIPKEALDDMPPNVKAEFIKMINQEIHYSLSIIQNESKYEMIKEHIRFKEFSSEKEGEDSKTTKKTNIKIEGIEIYKNFSTNNFLKKQSMGSKTYLISDELENLNWILKTEKQKIGNFNCKKAILKTDEGITIAWYTDEIPLNEGPSMYYGLPGLIIKIEASDRNYELIKFEKINEPLEIIKPKNGISINSLDFKKITNNTKKITVEESINEEPAKD